MPGAPAWIDRDLNLVGLRPRLFWQLQLDSQLLWQKCTDSLLCFGGLPELALQSMCPENPQLAVPEAACPSEYPLAEVEQLELAVAVGSCPKTRPV